jgi:hypothetical protein
MSEFIASMRLATPSGQSRSRRSLFRGSRKKTRVFVRFPNQSASSCVIRPESWRHASVPSELLEARASRCSVRMAPSNESRLQLLRPATFNHQSERWHSKPHGTFHRADRSIRRRDGCVFTVCPAENAGSNSRRSGPAGYANCLGSKRIGSPWRRAGQNLKLRVIARCADRRRCGLFV